MAELEKLGVDRFAGLAVETGSTRQAASVVRVSFDPASGPLCLWGDPYAAYYVDRGAQDLAIVLDVGGACWSSLCSVQPVVDDVISNLAVELCGLPLPGRDPDAVDFDDWNVISIPYCDGSVFMGDNDVPLEGGTTRHHHGRQNLAAGLDLAVKHFPHPRRILLAGASAGGYGTITAELAVRLRYPEARSSYSTTPAPAS